MKWNNQVIYSKCLSKSIKVSIYILPYTVYFLGFEQSAELDPKFVKYACRLSQMVTFLEQQSKQLPEVFRSNLTYGSSFILLLSCFPEIGKLIIEMSRISFQDGFSGFLPDAFVLLLCCT